MRLHNYIYLFALLIIVAASACEDVVDVDLVEADSQLVVDGWINNDPSSQLIKLRQSQPYFDNQFTDGVTGASVTVVRNDGVSFIFEDQGNGDYVWTPTAALPSLGEVGSGYTLEIQNGSKEYTSSTELYRVPEIDSIGLEFRDELFFEEGIYAQFYARDLVGLGDTYWIKTYKNDVYLADPFELNIAFDAGFSAGSEVDGIVFIPPIRELVNPNEVDSLGAYVPGDKIEVEIHSISNEAFFYMEVVRDQLLNSFNGIFAEPLTNTRGNIRHTNGSENVLGMFSVSAISRKERIVN